MITGLFANALGWRREARADHAALQHRLIMGSVRENPGEHQRDFQTARLGAGDKGWTTDGVPEARAGGAKTYDGPHLRYRDYHADLSTLVALRLEPPDAVPTLDDLATALDHPARPLFIGRKPCLPSGRVFAGWLEADNILDALRHALPDGRDTPYRAQWPDGEGELVGNADRLIDLCDERNWISGVHGGWRPVREGLFEVLGGKR